MNTAEKILSKGVTRSDFHFRKSFIYKQIYLDLEAKKEKYIFNEEII